MKTIRLLLHFYKENLAALFLLLAVTLFSTFMLTTTIAKISYATYTKELFEQSGLQNSVYYMPGSFQDTAEGLLKIRTDIEALNLPAVQDIVQGNGTSAEYKEQGTNVELFDSAYRSVLPPVDEGRALSDEDAKTPEIEAVVFGYQYHQVQVGEEIVITTNRFAKPPLTQKVKVVGQKKEPAYIMDFGYVASTVTAQLLYGQAHNMIAICKDDAPALFKGASHAEEGGIYGRASSNLFVRFKDSATPAEKEQAIAALSKTGGVLSYEEILKASNEAVIQELKQQLPRPLLMLFISTFSMVAIAVLIVDKKLKEYRIFFLCGCSRRRGFAQMLGAVSLLSVISCAVNLAYIAITPFLYGINTPLNPFGGEGKVVYGAQTVWAVLLYSIISLLASIIIPFLSIRKESAIQTYRK